MVFGLTRILEFAPAVVFAAATVFAVGAILIGVSPGSQLGWQMFLEPAPLVREPVHLVAHTLMLGYPGAAVLFLLAGLACIGFVLSSRHLIIPRFLAGHAALLMLFSAMGGAQVFQAGNEGVVVGEITLLSWAPNLWLFPPLGIALLAVVIMACASIHVIVIRGILRQHATRSEIERRLAEQLRAFA